MAAFGRVRVRGGRARFCRVTVVMTVRRDRARDLRSVIMVGCTATVTRRLVAVMILATEPSNSGRNPKPRPSVRWKTPGIYHKSRSPEYSMYLTTRLKQRIRAQHTYAHVHILTRGALASKLSSTLERACVCTANARKKVPAACQDRFDEHHDHKIFI